MSVTLPSRATLIASLQSSVTTSLGSVGDLQPLIEAFVDTLLEIWGDAKDVAAALEKTNAVGWSAEALAGIFGVLKLPVTSSEITVYVSGDPGTVVPANSEAASLSGEIDTNLGSHFVDEILALISEGEAENIWVTQSDVALKELELLPFDTQVEIGDRFYSYWELATQAGRRNICYECVVAGTTPTAEGMQHVYDQVGGDDSAVDGTAVFRTIGIGRAVAEVRCVSKEPGRVSDIAGAYIAIQDVFPSTPLAVVTGVGVGVCRIETPVSGWRGVLSKADASVGRLEESDIELMRRLVVSVNHDLPNQYGRATLTPSEERCLGIEATLVKVNGVVAARVWDVVGNLHAVVLGGDDEDVAGVIQNLLPIGSRIANSGNGTLVTVDVQQLDGKFRTIAFERPLTVPVTVVAKVVADSEIYPGDEAVEEAIMTLNLDRHERPIDERFQLGEDVSVGKILCSLLELSGVLNATIRINGDTANVPVGVYQHGEITSVDVEVYK